MADITDILASLDRPSSPSHPSTTSTTASLTDPVQTSLDHQQLTRFHISERTSPELLPWPSSLMSRILSRVRHQITVIEDLASTPTTTTNNANTNLHLAILQTDLSRTQFLIRSLLRCRLSKISRHAPYYLQQQQHARSSSSVSPSEAQFLTTSQSLLQGYYDASFLSSLPPQLQSLTDNTGGTNMVEGPDLKSAVLVRCLAEGWHSHAVGGSKVDGENWLNGSARKGGSRGFEQDLDEEEEEEGEREFEMRRGQVWVVRWEDVRKGVLSGQLELL